MLDMNVTESNKVAILSNTLNDLSSRLGTSIVDIALTVARATDVNINSIYYLSEGSSWRSKFIKFTGANISETRKQILSVDIIAVCLCCIIHNENIRVPRVKPPKYVISDRVVNDIVNFLGVSSSNIKLPSFREVCSGSKLSEFNVSVALIYLYDIYKSISGLYIEDELFDKAMRYVKAYEIVRNHIMNTENFTPLLRELTFSPVPEFSFRVNSAFAKQLTDFKLANYATVSDTELYSRHNLVEFCNNIRIKLPCYIFNCIGLTYSNNRMYTCIALDVIVRELSSKVPVPLTNLEVISSFTNCRNAILSFIAPHQLRTNLDGAFYIAGEDEPMSKYYLGVLLIAFNRVMDDNERLVNQEKTLDLCEGLGDEVE